MTAAMLLGALVVWLSACGSMSSPITATSNPVTPSPVAPNPAAPGPGAVVLGGTWSGTGSDSFSPELITWMITQSGTTLSGTVEINAVDPTDGTCGSCHKVKKGTLSGTLSASTVTIAMKFPAGGDVPAPICEADLSATGTLDDRRIRATYTGSDTCEGMYSNGVMELTRQ
jgi:hypothetical protein